MPTSRSSGSHSHSGSASVSEVDELEMTGMHDVVITPNPNLSGRGHDRYLTFDEDEDDEDEGGFDDGDRALLNPQGETRWRERSKSVGSVRRQAIGIALETFPTLLFTTVGTILTGELLEHVSRWHAMTSVNELIMIIPVMLNLKGNLEMNLSARLGTAANMGSLDSPSTRRSIILGNLALLQVQAALVSFVAACFSFLLGVVIPDETTSSPAAGVVNGTVAMMMRTPRPVKVVEPGHLDSALDEFLVVAASAMSATCLSAAVLGSFMCALIVLCRKLGRDPDNIAPPIAACLGDLVTLLLFSLSSSLLIRFASPPIVPPLIITSCVLLATACALFARKNKHVAHLLAQGWTPLFGAMVITSGSGIVLDVFVGRYGGYALLAVAFGGIPGGTGSILISRLSTSLHAASDPDPDPSPSSSTPSLLPAPKRPSHSHSRSNSRSNPTYADERDGDGDGEVATPRTAALTLLAVAVPISVFFLGALRVLGWLETPVGFFALALLFLTVAVAISLAAASLITHLLWRRKLDPDVHALPVHSALMDLSGQLLLVACFELARVLGLKVTAKKGGRGKGGG